MPRGFIAEYRALLGAVLATVIAVPAALAVAGCPAAGRTCTSAEDCGEDGLCEATGFCSFSDETCPSGRRYGDSSPSGEGGECVLSTGTTTGAVPPPPTPDESSDSGVAESTGSDGMPTGSTTGADDCMMIAVDENLLAYGAGTYRGEVTPSLADAVLPDVFELRFNTHVPGTFELGQSDWASLSSCPHCLTIEEDLATTYFATEGEFTVAAGSAPLDGRFQAQLSGVLFREATIDRDTGATIIIEDGDCLRVPDTNVAALQIPGWRCASGYFEDGLECDCGCGLQDPDCMDTTSASCEFCDTPGSCSEGQGGCPGAIDPIDNSTCDLTLWTCDNALFDAGDGICNCGCGLIDPDCEGSTIDACTVCSNAGSCTMGNECLGYVRAFNNGQCGMYPGWTCEEFFYDADDGCDCGCGLPDPDCETPTLASCVFCDNFGSCSELNCMNNPDLDPMDPSQCLPR